MSATATRGKEGHVRVTVNDDYAAQFGLFGLLPLFNINSWSMTPRTDLVEKEYCGEKTASLDTIHHGYDFAISGDETNNTILAMQELIQYKEENDLPPPDFTVAMTLVYRDGITLPRTHQMIDVVLKIGEHGFAGRSDYVAWTIEGKSRTKKTGIG